jgi:hypothetical protein
VADAAPAILDSVADLSLWLSGDNCEQLLQRLSSDIQVEHLGISIREGHKAGRLLEIKASAIYALESILDSDPPRLFGTYDRIRDILSTSRIGSGSILTRLNDGRAKALSLREQIQKKSKVPEVPPSDWIGPI